MAAAGDPNFDVLTLARLPKSNILTIHVNSGMTSAGNANFYIFGSTKALPVLSSRGEWCRFHNSPFLNLAVQFDQMMKPLPAPNVPGETEAERFDFAVRKMFSVSKDAVLKAEAKQARARARKRAKKAN
jgi:hypothetical protein